MIWLNLKARKYTQYFGISNPGPVNFSPSANRFGIFLGSCETGYRRNGISEGFSGIPEKQ